MKFVGYTFFEVVTIQWYRSVVKFKLTELDLTVQVMSNIHHYIIGTGHATSGVSWLALLKAALTRVPGATVEPVS